MAELTRRHLLGLGATGVLLAGCTAKPTHTSTPTPTPVTDADWDALAAKLKGSLVRPGQNGYDLAKKVENPRYDAQPLAVLTAAAASDVAAGLTFAKHFAVPLALRSGGHCYPGWSAGGAPGTGVPPSLVIDSGGMDAVTVDGDGTAHVEAGASLIQLYSTVGGAGRAIAAGSCPTVGVTGLTLGGGVGVLTRAYGLTCDALTAVEIVTADGRVRTATADSDSDLFWACRGGGGGHLGVVTKLTFTTVPAPDVTTFFLQWPFGNAADVVKAWQGWAPSADPRLWSTLKLLGGDSHPHGPGIFLSGTWVGAASQFDAQLAPLLAKLPAPGEKDVNHHSYLDAMMNYAGCSDIAVDKCNTGPDGKLPLYPFSATSHVPQDPLDDAGISDLITQVQGAQKVSGMTEGGISMDALGGKVADLAPDATAFVHRKALMTVQYTATFAAGADPSPYDAYVRGFRQAMVPHWGNTAYVNYADASLKDANTAYFGDNLSKLAAVAKKYDPHALFTQPQGY